MKHLIRDFRQAIREVAKNPAISAVAVLGTRARHWREHIQSHCRQLDGAACTGIHPAGADHHTPLIDYTKSLAGKNHIGRRIQFLRPTTET